MMKIEDALAIAYNYRANIERTGCHPSSTERLAIEVVERHANAALREHNPPPPKHWAMTKADELCQGCITRGAISAALVEAEQQGFLKAIGACNNYSKDIAGSLTVPSRDISVVDAVIKRIFAARKREADNAHWV